MWTILFASLAQAQNLLAPVSFPSSGIDVYVVLDDGSRIEGHVGLSTEVMGKPRYKIKDAERTKHKIDHERVVEAGIRLEGPPAPAAGSIQDALRNKRPELPPPEWLTFHRVPVALGEAPLLMLLNPGFDRRLRVYPDPAARTTSGIGIAGVSVTGGLPSSYLVWRAGAPAPERLEKGSYEEAWDALFADCAAVARPEKIKWADFEEHLFLADQACAD